MNSTTESAMATLIYAAIVALTPRVTYGDDTWRAYARKGEHGRDEPTNAGPPAAKPKTEGSRRFRLEWRGGAYQERGIWTNRQVETVSRLSVIVDYVGNAADQHTIEYVAIDDYHHIRDTLVRLKSPSNGIMFVTPVELRVSGGTPETPRTTRMAFVFDVRYLRETREVWS